MLLVCFFKVVSVLQGVVVVVVVVDNVAFFRQHSRGGVFTEILSRARAWSTTEHIHGCSVLITQYSAVFNAFIFYLINFKIALRVSSYGTV